MSPRRVPAFLGCSRPWKGRRRRQVSWLRGSLRSPWPSQASVSPSDQFGGPLAAYSCGHSRGFSPRSLFSLHAEGTVGDETIGLRGPRQRVPAAPRDRLWEVSPDPVELAAGDEQKFRKKRRCKDATTRRRSRQTRRCWL